MMKKPFLLITLFTLILLALATPTLAHESRETEQYVLVFGIRNEPVYAGLRSGPELLVYQNNNGQRGERVEGGEFSVDIIFGDQTLTTPLNPAFADPGHYVADVIFTLPGDYEFHLTGTIEGNTIDEVFNTADGQFGPVEPVSDIQFPLEAPETLDLAETISELQATIADLQARVEALEAQ
jgi:hypothetical protein